MHACWEAWQSLVDSSTTTVSTAVNLWVMNGLVKVEERTYRQACMTDGISYT